MKRFLALLTALCLLLALCPARASAEDGVSEIRDAQGLRRMAEAPEGRYVLCADIDMDGEDWTPFAFSGELDGGGHCIYNLSVTRLGTERQTTVDGNHKEYDTVFSGLFSCLTGAEIHDLTLMNLRCRVETGDNAFIGLLAGFVDDAVIRDCSVSGTAELHSGGRMVGVGGVAGFGIATFERCTVDAALIHVDESVGFKCEQFTGGVLACGYCVINYCEVHVEGYTSCHGYVHDGGLIGMHHQHDMSGGKLVRASEHNHVTGFITFFEDNRDRRAYCEAYCGENLHWTMSLSYNTQSFERREVFDYSETLSPHMNCTGASWTESSAAPDCENWGCTVYTCSACGYSYRDHYTPPVHEPGEWEIVTPATGETEGRKERRCLRCGTVIETAVIAPHIEGDWAVLTAPDYENEGLRGLLCADCGEVLRTEPLPRLKRIAAVLLEAPELTLEYHASRRLAVGTGPSDAADHRLLWTSSDPAVVTVDENGRIYAAGAGSAVITCQSADGGASARCTVTVTFSPVQRLIRVLLFGWLWY